MQSSACSEPRQRERERRRQKGRYTKTMRGLYSWRPDSAPRSVGRELVQVAAQEVQALVWAQQESLVV
jgi:hypothetical protein